MISQTMKKVIDSGYLIEPSFPSINESEVVSFIDYIATLEPRPMVIETKHYRDFLKTQQPPKKKKHGRAHQSL